MRATQARHCEHGNKHCVHKPMAPRAVHLCTHVEKATRYHHPRRASEKTEWVLLKRTICKLCCKRETLQEREQPEPATLNILQLDTTCEPAQQRCTDRAGTSGALHYAVPMQPARSAHWDTPPLAFTKSTCPRHMGPAALIALERSVRLSVLLQQVLSGRRGCVLCGVVW